MSTVEPIRSFSASADRLLSAAPVEGLPNVASLDAPHVKQTKTEIRKLAAEIAELAHSNVSKGNFFHGFLSKLTLAMGASGAAVWDCPTKKDPEAESSHPSAKSPPRSFGARASYQMPPELLNNSGEAPQEHARILECVLRERQPILIPPQAVAVDAERPSNPTNEALVIVPVILEGNVECLIEVVQTACGGPSAQRGYLRFVAQMADLFADYLRRQMLKELAERQKQTEQTEGWIFDAIQCASPKTRTRIVADGLTETLQAQQAFRVQQSSWPIKRTRVLAASHLKSLDPRSEVAELINGLVSLYDSSAEGSLHTQPFGLFEASDRRSDTQQDTPEGQVAKGRSPQALNDEQQRATDALCALLQCRSIAIFDDAEDCGQYWMLCFDAKQTADLARSRPEESLLHAPRTRRLLRAASLLAGATQAPTRPSKTKWQNKQLLRRAAAWSMVIAAVTFVAFLPVPQQVRVQAILQPVNKYNYYAPDEAFVEEVHVREGEQVEDQQPLMRLRSRKLESQLESLLGERDRTNNRIAELENRLGRDGSLSALELDRIEAELGQLQSTRESIAQQLSVLRDSQQDLQVFALGSGQVSTWDLNNRLKNRPVEAGQLLATTYDPDGPWRLQIAVPQHRIGLVMANMRAESTEPKVRFSLLSHPDQTLEAKLERLASQVVSDETDASVLYGEASLDASQLPIRKDGAIANATVDCGTVPAYWLVIRDAYWAIRSRTLLYR